MMTLVIAIKSETPCEPELLLLVGTNEQLYAAGLLELLRSGKPAPKKMYEVVQTLFSAKNEMHKLVAFKLGSKTKVV